MKNHIANSTKKREIVFPHRRAVRVLGGLLALLLIVSLASCGAGGTVPDTMQGSWELVATEDQAAQTLMVTAGGELQFEAGATKFSLSGKMTEGGMIEVADPGKLCDLLNTMEGEPVRFSLMQGTVLLCTSEGESFDDLEVYGAYIPAERAASAPDDALLGSWNVASGGDDHQLQIKEDECILTDGGMQTRVGKGGCTISRGGQVMEMIGEYTVIDGRTILLRFGEEGDMLAYFFFYDSGELVRYEPGDSDNYVYRKR